MGPFTPLLTKLEQRLKCFLVTLLGGCEVYLTTLVPGFWDWLALDDVKGKQRFQLGLGLMSYGEERICESLKFGAHHYFKLISPHRDASRTDHHMT